LGIFVLFRYFLVRTYASPPLFWLARWRAGLPAAATVSWWSYVCGLLRLAPFTRAQPSIRRPPYLQPSKADRPPIYTRLYLAPRISAQHYIHSRPYPAPPAYTQHAQYTTPHAIYHPQIYTVPPTQTYTAPPTQYIQPQIYYKPTTNIIHKPP